jgi:hypothetical protein
MTRPTMRALGWVVVSTLGTLSARGQTSYPMVARVQPTAIQRGQSADVTIGGAGSFDGATDLLFDGTGLRAEILPTEPKPATPAKKGRRNNASSIRVRLTVSPDAALGPRELRVVTPQGVSSIGLIVIVADPVVVEANDKANDDPSHPETIPIPSVATGVISKVEDVDWYAFHADAGQHVSLSVWGNRLEDKIHDLQQHFDPILILRDERGRELAVNDNALFADPMLSYAVRESGTYLLEVRDTTYAGNPNWSYVLSATAGPVATSVFPMAVNPGSCAELHAWGINVDPAETIRLAVPADTVIGPTALSLPTTRGATPPTPVVVTALPRISESDDAPEEALRGQQFSIPAAISGRLGEPNDTDSYRFIATKGTSYDFEVVARRAGSGADPVLRVLDAKGKVLTEADDTRGLGKDARLTWTAPADDGFVLQITDLHSRGGEGYGYVLLAEESPPDFVLTCDPDKLNVGPGARTPVFVKVERRNGFTGPVTVSWDGLPSGVSVSPLTLAPTISQGEIVLAASADAPRCGALVSLVGRAESSKGALVRRAMPQQEIYLPGGGRAVYPVNTMAVGVTDPSDITVEASPTEIALEPGKSVTIDVTIRRREGFTQPVNLAVELQHLGSIYANPLPPGVVVSANGSKTLLGPTETAGKIVLEAKPNASPVGPVPIAIMGHVSINFVVKTAFSSGPIQLKVLGK